MQELKGRELRERHCPDCILHIPFRTRAALNLGAGILVNRRKRAISKQATSSCVPNAQTLSPTFRRVITHPITYPSDEGANDAYRPVSLRKNERCRVSSS